MGSSEIHNASLHSTTFYVASFLRHSLLLVSFPRPSVLERSIHKVFHDQRALLNTSIMSLDSSESYPLEKGNWGAEAASHFVSTIHHKPNTTLDTTKVSLPRSFVVCIVGASRGIGAGIAISYAKAGASGLVLASRSTSGLEETAENCKALRPGIDVEIVPSDITSSESVANLAERTKAKFGRLDVAVVNSGYSGNVTFNVIETDPETFRNCIDVNYVGTFLSAKYLVPLLLETSDGAKAFIGVSSLAALLLRGPIANGQYALSKLTQLRLLEYVHEQHAEQGLSSFAVHPGAVASEMAKEGAPDV